MSKEILFGYKLGKGSVHETINNIIKPSLGEKLTILVAVDELSPATLMEMEIESATAHFLEQSEEISGQLRVDLAKDYVNSKNKLIVSDHELMTALPQISNTQEKKESEKQ